MNNVLCLVKGSRNPFNPGPGVSSDQMFCELLALHEEMIVQLRLERPSGIATLDFIKGMIEQHENAAAMLRSRFEFYEADTT